MDTEFTHGLRNCISAVLSASHSLLDELPAAPSEQSVLLQAIQQSCHSMLHMVEDSPKLARRRKSKIQFSSTDLISLVRQRLALKRPAARNRNINLELITDCATPAIQVEAREIDALLDEWISYILNVARPGTKVEVRVRVKAGQLMMSVYNARADESKPDALPGIERKKDLSATTIDRSVLSVVTRTIESHKGHLQVESGSGMGPRLTIRLPLTRVDKRASAVL